MCLLFFWLFNIIQGFNSLVFFSESVYTKYFTLSVKTGTYDTYFGYRFMYNLRNYIIHEDLAVLKITRKLEEDHIDICFEIDNNALIESSRCQKNFKEELTKKSPTGYTNLNGILSNFYEILLKLHIVMLTNIWQELRNNFKCLMDNIPNKQDVFLLQNGKIKNNLLNVTTKYYKCVSDYFVYSENLLQEKDVNKFFR